MIKCPRCNIQQEDSSQCEYCGLIFKEYMESTRRYRTTRLRRIAFFVFILVVTGALLAYYGFIPSRHKTGAPSTIVADSSVSLPKTTNNDLRTAAKELTGDVGIIKGFADGSTKGSIIAMVGFSIVGMGYFAYGKKSQHLLMLICGIALMVYSYLVTGTVYIILIGIALSVLPFILGRR
jgi:hypothetical protein